MYLSKKAEAAYRKSLAEQEHCLHPEALRMVCESYGYDATKIGEWLLGVLADFRSKGIV